MKINKKFIISSYHFEMFPSDIENTLKTNKISYGTAIILKDITQQEREHIYQLLMEIQLGANKMREVVENLIEISKRDNWAISNLIEKSDIQKVIKRQDIGKKKKGEEVRKILAQLRYPQLTKKKEEFQKKVNDIKLNGKTKITPDENFESGKINIKISISNPDELKEIINELDEKFIQISKLFY